MYKNLFAMALLCVATSVSAQLILPGNETAAELANYLVGNNVSISDIKFNGSTANANLVRDQFTRFNFTLGDPILFSTGLILATGKTSLATGPNDLGNATEVTVTPSQGDNDLAQISGQAIQNKAIVEFDFVPAGETISFNYKFASEEYPEWVNTIFNDVLGIFLSGPGIAGPFANGALNIAVLPESSVPVGINTVNNGFNNSGPCGNCDLYINNGTGTTPLANSKLQYDGLTTTLTASSAVIPGEVYHLKIAIANVSDNSNDSALFLQSASLSSAPLGSIGFQNQDSVLFLNPVDDKLELQLKRDSQNMETVTIYNLVGDQVNKTTAIASNHVVIDISSLPQSIYMVEIVTTEQIVVRQKIVVR